MSEIEPQVVASSARTEQRKKVQTLPDNLWKLEFNKVDTIIRVLLISRRRCTGKNSKSVFNYKISAQKDDPPYGHKTLIAVAEAESETADILALFFQHNGLVPIPQDDVMAVARSPGSKKMMEVLSEHHIGLAITENFLAAAVLWTNDPAPHLRVSPNPILELLLRHKSQLNISERIMTNIAASCGNGHEFFNMFLLYQSD